MKLNFALLSLFILLAMKQAGMTFAQATAFRAPRLWEAADADSYYPGPARIYPAGQGGLWLTGQDSDWLNGEPTGLPIRVRLADGSRDASFQPGTLAGFSVWGFLEQPDGRVVMAVGRPRAWAIVRLMPDGRPDPAWRVLKTLAHPRTLARDGDGRIIAALSPGNPFTDPEPEAFAPAATTVVRLLPDGGPDPAFTPPAITDGLFTTLWAGPGVDDRGGIRIGGGFGPVKVAPAVNVARLLPDGALDAGFQPDVAWSGTASVVRDLALQPDGKIVLAGRFRIPGHTTTATELLLLRLLPDGPMDPGFGRVTCTQAATSDYARGLTLTAEGGLVINAGGLRKFTPAGALDDAFLAANPGFSLSLAGLPDGRFVLPAIAGLPGLPAYAANGAPLGLLTNLTFGGTRVPGGFAVLGGGDVLVAGQFTRADAAVQHALVKLAATTGGLATEQPDPAAWHGARRAASDPSFPQSVTRLPDGGVAYLNSLISATADPFQPDYFYTVLGGLPDTALLARLGTNGTVDAGFRPPVFGHTPGRVERPGVLALAVDAQRRIYVAGSFDLMDGRPARGLARLLPDGAVDAEFDPPIESVAYPSEVEASLYLEGETLWVGGTFRALDETFPRPVWKLSTVTGPRLTAPALADGVFTAQTTLAAGRSYRFQRTQDFATWTDLATLAGDGSTVTLQDPAVPGTHAGYRLVSP